MASSPAANELEAALEDALTERGRLWAQLQCRAARERELEDCHATIAHMRSSMSWRVTSPLRMVKRGTGKIQANLKRFQSR